MVDLKDKEQPYKIVYLGIVEKQLGVKNNPICAKVKKAKKNESKN